MTAHDVVAALAERSGMQVAGAFAFGDSPQLQDELLDFVRRGTKRATCGSVAELEAEDDPLPEPGLRWGLLDGSGQAHLVMETVEVARGRLIDVTPAFAWDEGEHDRTLESWLEGHRRYFRRQGIAAPDDLPVLFERFRIVWPEPDTTRWLAEGVRELRWDERPWLRSEAAAVADLPALTYERDGQTLGVLAFRATPTTLDAVAVLELAEGAAAPLYAGLAALESQPRG